MKEGVIMKNGIILFILLCILICNAGASLQNGIIIGTIIDEHGDSVSQAQGIEAAIDLAISDLNESYKKSGLEMTVAKRKAVTNGTGESAVQAALELTDQGVQVIVGPYSSEEVAAILPILTQKKIISVNPSTSPTLSLSGDPLVRLCPDDTHLVHALFTYTDLTDIVPSTKKAVILAREDLYGKTMAEKIGLHGDVIDVIMYPPNTRDFTSTLIDLDSTITPLIEEAGEENIIVYAVAFDEIGDLLAQVSKYPNLQKIRWIGMDAVALASPILENETAAEFAYQTGMTALAFNVAQPPSSDYWRVFDAIQQAKNGKIPSIYEILFYDQTLMAAWIVQNNPETLEDMLYIADNYGRYSYAATGWLKLNENSDREYGDYYFYRVEKTDDGGYYWKPVYVYKYESDSVFPLEGVNNTFMQRYLAIT